MRHKNTISSLLAAALAAALLVQPVMAEEAASAAEEESTEYETQEEVSDYVYDDIDIPDTQIRVVALKGPTAMGMVGMMEMAEAEDDVPWEFTIAAAVDEVPPALVKKEADIAAVPANLAAVLYQNTEGAIQVLGINTLGVIYIVDRDGSIETVDDLKGRTIFASGKGATPEYALNYILTENGIDPAQDVTIEWKSEHAECLAALLADESAVAMLPQPFVTTAQMKDDSVRVALDLTEEWDRIQEGAEEPSAMLTGVVVVRKEFAEENPEAVQAFLEAYKVSVDFVNGDTAGAAALVGGYDIVPEPVALKAIPFCNITLISGQEMQEKLSGYLQVLYDQNPAAVGGNLPGEDFYYTGEQAEEIETEEETEAETETAAE